MASVRGTPAATTGSAVSSLTFAHTTDSDTDDLAVLVGNSHARTISSITFDGAALSEVVTATTISGSRSSIWRLNAAPGSKTANVVVTFSASSNCVAVPVNIGETSRTVLDTASLGDNDGGATGIALDPTATGALCLASFLRENPSALTFASSGGTEHIDAAAATGRFGVGSVVADAATELMDWGTLASNGFAHVAAAWETEAGGGAEDYEGGSNATVNVDAAGGGQKSASGGAAATVNADASGAGQKSAQAGAAADVEVGATGGGTKTALSGSAAIVEASAQGAGSKHAQSGSGADVEIDATGGGTAAQAGSGGSSAAIQVDAAGAGTKAAQGGAAAIVSVNAAGAGTTTRSGGSTVTVTVNAAGGGLNPEEEILPSFIATPAARLLTEILGTRLLTSTPPRRQ